MNQCECADCWPSCDQYVDPGDDLCDDCLQDIHRPERD